MLFHLGEEVQAQITKQHIDGWIRGCNAPKFSHAFPTRNNLRSRYSGNEYYSHILYYLKKTQSYGSVNHSSLSNRLYLHSAPSVILLSFFFPYLIFYQLCLKNATSFIGLPNQTLFFYKPISAY